MLKKEERGLLNSMIKRDEMKNNIKSNSKKEFNNYFKNWRGSKSKGYTDCIIFLMMKYYLILLLMESNQQLASFMKDEINKNYESNIIDLGHLYYFYI